MSIIKNTKYYQKQRQQFIQNYQNDIVNMILQGKRNKIIAQNYIDENHSLRQILDYIKIIAEKNNIYHIVLEASKKYNKECHSLEKEKEQMFELIKNEIQVMIDNGAINASLEKKFILSLTEITKRIDKQFKEKLKQNNQKAKSEKMKQFHKQQRQNQLQEYQSKILEFIQQNNYDVSIGQIRQKFGRKGCIIPILNKHNLYSLLRAVGKQRSDQMGRKNGNKGGKVVKEHFKIKLQKEISQYQERFLMLVRDQYYKALIIRDAKQNNISIVAVQKLIQKHNDKVVCYINSKHHKNGMFGIQPPAGSGIGSSGWIQYDGKKILFRSTLQCYVFSYLFHNKIDFKISKHKIPYQFDNKQKNYHPDITIETTVFQIKPKGLLTLKINEAKFTAAKEYCEKYKLKFDIITQDTFDIYSKENIEFVDVLLRNERITFTNEKSKQKFLKLRKKL